MYLTMELSGLPPETSPAFAKLNAARDASKKFFGSNLPGMTYDFYSPPIPVKVKDSLFFERGARHGLEAGPRQLEEPHADGLGSPSDYVDRAGPVRVRTARRN